MQWIQSKLNDSDGATYFKGVVPLRPGDEWEISFNMGIALGSPYSFAYIGFAGQDYDPEKYGETYKNCARIYLDNNGSRVMIYEKMSIDGKMHSDVCSFPGYQSYNGKIKLSLRIDSNNFPQVKYKNDDKWCDFISSKDRVALKQDSYYPFMVVWNHSTISNHIVTPKKPTKSANKKRKCSDIST